MSEIHLSLAAASALALALAQENRFKIQDIPSLFLLEGERASASKAKQTMEIAIKHRNSQPDTLAHLLASGADFGFPNPPPILENLENTEAAFYRTSWVRLNHLRPQRRRRGDQPIPGAVAKKKHQSIDRQIKATSRSLLFVVELGGWVGGVRVGWQT